MLTLATILYGLFAGGAALWCWLADRFPWPLYDPSVSDPRHLLIGLGLGLAGGLAVVLASRAMVARWAWARTLHGWFRETLGPLTAGQVLALALLSSIGEELFFRGAMQPAWGLWPATLIFAALHFPSHRALWPWTVMAGVLGLAFGYLTNWSGSIAGATVAHFLINLLNLRHIVGLDPGAGQKLPPQDRPPSMDGHEAPRTADRGNPDPDPSGPDGPGQRP